MEMEVYDKKKESMMVNYINGDGNFFETYAFNFLHGLPYSVADLDGKAVVNQSFMTKIGFKTSEEIIDKEMVLGKDTLQIVGVVQDFPCTVFTKIYSAVIDKAKSEKLLNTKH